MAVDLLDFYEIVDDALVFGGISLVFFGQLWGIALVLAGLGIMYVKGEISLGGEKRDAEQLSKEEEKYFQYTGESEQDMEDGGEQGEGDGDDGE